MPEVPGDDVAPALAGAPEQRGDALSRASDRLRLRRGQPGRRPRWLGTLELRHDLDWGCAGRCTGSVFVDHGALRIDARPWAAGSNRATLNSVGVGFTWLGPSQWQAQVQLAKPFGAETALAARQTGARLWVWLLKGF